MKKNSLFISKYFFILILSLIILIPIWLMIINSFKSSSESLNVGINFPTDWRIIENYSKVIKEGNILRALANSLIITISSSILIVFISSMAAYYFSRNKSKKTQRIFYLFLLGLMLPPAIIVNVLFLKYLGLLGSLYGIILFYSGILLPFPIFILTGFVSTIPREMEESAYIDGASPFKTFIYIIFPLLKPAIATTAIWSVLVVWNDFMYPLYVLAGKTEFYPVTLSVYYFKNKFYTQWNLVFADIFLITVPVLIIFIFLQRNIIQGLTAGSIKG